MQLYYKVKGGAGDWTLLADVSGNSALREWKPKATGQLQKENLAAMPSQITAPFRQPIGNIRETIPIVLDISYASYVAALTTAASVKTAFLGKITHLKAVESSLTQYYANGVTDSMETAVAGCNVVYTFTIETDLVSSTEPA